MPEALPPIEVEIQATFASVDAMIAAYQELNGRRKTGDVHSTLYDDLIEFANFRVETATSVVLLAQNGKVSDALGLCRSVLEHMLLLRLQCRGNRYFEIQPLKKKPAEEIALAKATLADLHSKGEGLHCLAVEMYPQAGPPRLMWVYRGLASTEEPDEYVSIHYFQFQQFRPDVMRLDDEHYLDYMPADWVAPQSLVAAKKKHKTDAEFRYRYYLSWPALLMNLKLNELASEEEIRRIEAHYTFLGAYLHPTHNAARDLHEKANFFNGVAAVGLNHNYTRVAVLLTGLYAAWLLRAVMIEIADLLEAAPPRNIREPGTATLREQINYIPQRFEYFWFIDNEAPLWDKFNHAIHQSTDDELKAAGGNYSGLSSDGIRFESNVFSHLQQALGAWDNSRVGKYPSPLA